MQSIFDASQEKVPQRLQSKVCYMSDEISSARLPVLYRRSQPNLPCRIEVAIHASAQIA